MQRFSILFLLTVIAALVDPTAGWAKSCKLDLRDVRTVTFEGSGGRGYHPFAPSNGLTMVEFTVRHSNDACDYFVTFSTGGSGTYDRIATHKRDDLRYNVYGSSSASALPLRDIPEATADTVLSGSFEDGREDHVLRYWIDVPSRQDVESGNYSDRIRLSVYSGDLNSFSREDTANARIKIPVLAVVDVEIAVGGLRLPLEGASVTLDFGSLEPRERGSFALFVEGNTPFEVEISSLNGGELLLDGFARDHNVIPYSITFAGSTRVLSTPWLIDVSGSRLRADRHEFTVTIGEFEEVLRGTYSDTLTLSVTAQ